LLAAEAGAAVKRSPDDLKEAGDYVTALEYGISRLKELPISVRLVRELHQKLMTEVRGHNAAPSDFRRIQNWIGAPALAHYQFEAIHPFLEGNGRVGRLLITLFLVERRILPTPLLYLSAFFEASRRNYYDSLRAVSQRGAWAEWLEHFLLGVARTSEDALNRAMRINQMLAQWQKAVAGKSTSTPLRMVELLGANPFITIKGAAEELEVAFTTAQRAIEKLERSGILKPASKARPCILRQSLVGCP
jgi:cell filamentation protein, protein adenylyltransferase